MAKIKVGQYRVYCVGGKFVYYKILKPHEMVTNIWYLSKIVQKVTFSWTEADILIDRPATKLELILYVKET